MGIDLYKGWNTRATDLSDEIEPYKRFYFICKGANTERYYFEEFINNRKVLGIPSIIEIQYIKRTGNDKHSSAPKNLIEKANELIKEETIEFDTDRDKMIIVFDADIFEYDNPHYEEVLDSKTENMIFAVTNPNFELFLLLHIDNAFEEILKPNLSIMLNKENLGKNGLTNRLLKEVAKINSKKDKEKVASLVNRIKDAIEEEKNLNQDIYNCKGIVTSNVGKVIEDNMFFQDVPY